MGYRRWFAIAFSDAASLTDRSVRATSNRAPKPISHLGTVARSTDPMSHS